MPLQNALIRQSSSSEWYRSLDFSTEVGIAAQNIINFMNISSNMEALCIKCKKSSNACLSNGNPKQKGRKTNEPERAKMRD